MMGQHYVLRVSEASGAENALSTRPALGNALAERGNAIDTREASKPIAIGGYDTPSGVHKESNADDGSQP
jgi:hypothetical protein